MGSEHLQYWSTTDTFGSGFIIFCLFLFLFILRTKIFDIAHWPGVLKVGDSAYHS